MNLNSLTVQACIAGTQAEFQGQGRQALSHYQKAWELAQTPEDQCIAAHYLAHLALDPQEALGPGIKKP